MLWRLLASTSRTVLTNSVYRCIDRVLSITALRTSNLQPSSTVYSHEKCSRFSVSSVGGMLSVFYSLVQSGIGLIMMCCYGLYSCWFTLAGVWDVLIERLANVMGFQRTEPVQYKGSGQSISVLKSQWAGATIQKSLKHVLISFIRLNIIFRFSDWSHLLTNVAFEL